MGTDVDEQRPETSVGDNAPEALLEGSSRTGDRDTDDLLENRKKNEMIESVIASSDRYASAAGSLR